MTVNSELYPGLDTFLEDLLEGDKPKAKFQKKTNGATNNEPTQQDKDFFSDENKVKLINRINEIAHEKRARWNESGYHGFSDELSPRLIGFTVSFGRKESNKISYAILPVYRIKKENSKAEFEFRSVAITGDPKDMTTVARTTAQVDLAKIFMFDRGITDKKIQADVLEKGESEHS